jgi:hypothetical protein
MVRLHSPQVRWLGRARDWAKRKRNSNRNSPRIEIGVSHSKQTIGTNSNRNTFRGLASSEKSKAVAAEAVARRDGIAHRRGRASGRERFESWFSAGGPQNHPGRKRRAPEPRSPRRAPSAPHRAVCLEAGLAALLEFNGARRQPCRNM